MDIRIVDSLEFTDKDWAGYTAAWNAVYKVYNKGTSEEAFRHKYLTTIAGTSYHALMIHADEIVGACTVMPYDYLVGAEKVRAGLAVDVFILESFRNDPYGLYRMYDDLRRHLIEQGICLVLAVPNDIAYPYWKRVVKWHDIGCIPYYCLPVRAASVLGSRAKVLNVFSRYLCWLYSGLQAALTLLWNPQAREQRIRIDRGNCVVEQQRYGDEHTRVVLHNHCFSYRVVNENGIVVAYLIDFFNSRTRVRDAKTLNSAVRHIMREHAVDLILFVGKLALLQAQLLRVPFGKEPRHLPLIADILVDHDGSLASLVLDYANWDFGLFNFDVR